MSDSTQDDEEANVFSQLLNFEKPVQTTSRWAVQGPSVEAEIDSICYAAEDGHIETIALPS